MGGGTSRQVTVPLAPASAVEHARSRGDAAAEEAASQRRVAESAYRDAEDALFKEGYRRGATDTLARLDDELAKQARAAFAASALADEAAKAAFVERELQRVAIEARKRSPRRPLECQDEERAVVTCDARVDAARCASAIAAYAACADALLVRLATPALGPLK